MKEIITGWVLYFFYSVGFIKNEYIKFTINHREDICKKCVLEKDGWCSKNKEVITHYNDENIIKTKVVNGCGCYLKAKYFSQLKPGVCPLDKWKE